MESLDVLRHELAECNAQIEQHLASSISGSTMNPAGDIGGIRSRSQKRKQQIFDRYSREARRHVELIEKRDSLKQRIAYIESQPKRDRTLLQRDIALYHWWNNLKSGDTIKPGNNALLIVKKNTKSVVTAGGSKWTIHEITGLSNSRISEIKAHLTRDDDHIER